ncbi:FAD-dependent monooxygenase [Azospirillum sp. SYSU D00513]|uniref:FAD-dependent monooxygenase n=1 Tax=Azospirillum sp. SYSU D00513 TaxID=2812561 RepID=UPI001A9717B1|nr:FAD-dependent monooxygenase [Azospirillum sp. SYSU D00513]
MTDSPERTDIPEETDVLIAGAGPTGLALALALRRLGVAALLIDRQAEGANTSRAAAVHARTLEVLEPLGVTPDLLAQGIRVPVFRVRDRSRVLLSVPFAGLPTHYPFTLMCPQDRTEAALLARLRALGGGVLRPAELASLQEDGDGVLAVIVRNGVRRTVRARWLAGCDGAHSLVRTEAGIAFEGGTYGQDFVLADLRMDWPFPREEVSLFLVPGGLMVVAPLPDDRFRIVATVESAPEAPRPGDVQRILRERGPEAAEARLREMVWSSRFRVHHRLAATMRRRRVLLCGDAAHLHSPAGGQGMNTGIQDAVSLAEPLAQALRTGGEEGLDAWAARRRAIAGRVVGFTDVMTRTATLSSAPARSLRNGALAVLGRLPPVTRRIARGLAELDNV